LDKSDRKKFFDGEIDFDVLSSTVVLFLVQNQHENIVSPLKLQR
jgi:hypothetical protein